LPQPRPQPRPLPVRLKPCPVDFRDRFLELGNCFALQRHYGVSFYCIQRWIDECGGDELRAARRAVVRCTLKLSLHMRSGSPLPPGYSAEAIAYWNELERSSSSVQPSSSSMPVR
jgi:hypothetical protein